MELECQVARDGQVRGALRRVAAQPPGSLGEGRQIVMKAAGDDGAGVALESLVVEPAVGQLAEGDPISQAGSAIGVGEIVEQERLQEIRQYVPCSVRRHSAGVAELERLAHIGKPEFTGRSGQRMIRTTCMGGERFRRAAGELLAQLIYARSQYRIIGRAKGLLRQQEYFLRAAYSFVGAFSGSPYESGS